MFFRMKDDPNTQNRFHMHSCGSENANPKGRKAFEIITIRASSTPDLTNDPTSTPGPGL